MGYGASVVDPRGRLLPRSYDMLGELQSLFIIVPIPFIDSRYLFIYLFGLRSSQKTNPNKSDSEMANRALIIVRIHFVYDNLQFVHTVDQVLHIFGTDHAYIPLLLALCEDTQGISIPKHTHRNRDTNTHTTFKQW